MNENSQDKLRAGRRGRTMWITLALAALVAAASVTDTQAQTRVRGKGESDVNNLDCWDKTSATDTLPPGKKEAKFKISERCYCSELPNIRGQLQLALKNMKNSMLGKGSPNKTTKAAVADIRDNHDKKLREWLALQTIHLGPAFSVIPPAGGSKSKIHYCYGRDYVFGLFRTLVTGRP